MRVILSACIGEWGWLGLWRPVVVPTLPLLACSTVKHLKHCFCPADTLTIFTQLSAPRRRWRGPAGLWCLVGTSTSPRESAYALYMAAAAATGTILSLRIIVWLCVKRWVSPALCWPCTAVPSCPAFCLSWPSLWLHLCHVNADSGVCCQSFSPHLCAF